MTPDDSKSNSSDKAENKAGKENKAAKETGSNAEFLMRANEKTKNVEGTRVNFSESSQKKPEKSDTDSDD